MDEDVYAPKVDYSSAQAPSLGKPSGPGFGAHLVDFIQTLVVFGAIFAVIYLFVAQPHKVSGNSMVPNFHDGEYILTDKISYRLGKPQRGDIIVLKNPRDESQDFIKRIISLPSDTITIQGGRVYVNDNIIAESYLPRDTLTRGGSSLAEGKPFLLETNQYFVLGDNRNHSSDSREIGTIGKNLIIGKVFFRYWPPISFGLIKHFP